MGRLRKNSNHLKTAIRVLIADDHPLMRAGLRACLSEVRSIQVIGDATDGEAALRKVSSLRPDVVLMDLSMPKLDGIGAIEKLRQVDPQMKVLVLSMHADAEHIRHAVQAGARGYILKDCTTTELRRAIETVGRGDLFFRGAIADIVASALVEAQKETSTSTQTTDDLSPREKEVLSLVASGLRNREIAEKLKLSPRTVEAHRARIVDKLDIHTTAGLTRYAIEHGIMSV